MNSIKCTKENWKERLNHFFSATRDIYSRHFNQPVTLEGFPSSFEALYRDYDIEHADKEVRATYQRNFLIYATRLKIPR